MENRAQHEPRGTQLASSSENAAHAASANRPQEKRCVICGVQKPLVEFKRRSGRRAGRTGRRGACRHCRQLDLAAQSASEPVAPPVLGAAAADAMREAAAGSAAAEPPHAGGASRKRRKRRRRRSAKTAALVLASQALTPGLEQAPLPVRRVRRPLPTPPPRPEGPDAAILTPLRSGFVKMRGKTDKGRRWVQDTDLETAINLVVEHAAVVVNRHTIRRLYTNKSFRSYILTRDRYTCHFCGDYGDTIDHVVPRAKGGHTTPMNCVCACHLCNQSKADQNFEDFVTDDEEA